MASECPSCKLTLTKGEKEGGLCPSCGSPLDNSPLAEASAINRSTNFGGSEPIKIRESVPAALTALVFGVILIAIGVFVSLYSKDQSWGRYVGFFLFLIIGGFISGVGVKMLLRRNKVILEFNDLGIISYDYGAIRWNDIEDVHVVRRTRKRQVIETILELRLKRSAKLVAINVTHLDRPSDEIISIVAARLGSAQ